jgi:hypothetical protein
MCIYLTIWHETSYERKRMPLYFLLPKWFLSVRRLPLEDQPINTILEVQEFMNSDINTGWLRFQRNHSSAVSIATGYGMHDRWVGVRVPLGLRISSCPYRPDRVWSPLQLVPAGLSSGRGGGTRKEAQHSPPTSAEAKKTWIYTFTPPYVFMA